MTTPQNILVRHKILHELGRGPVGAVYAARDRTTGAVVALKRLDPALLNSDAGLAARFLKQARSAQRLRHRNIVRIHEAGEAAGTAYVAMEMLEGESLRKILDDGPLPVARAIRIAHEVASGLAHAHLEGVVHGGVKPSNIIVSPSGAAKITDFGVALLGQPLSAGGGPEYLSPEQVRGDPVDHRCDIFSLGAVFYEMLTRRRLFEGGSLKEIMESILHAAPPPPSELNPHVPRALDAMVLSMLAAQPAARMAGLPLLLPGLQRLEEGLGLGPGASAAPAEPPPSVPPAEPAPRAAQPPAADEVRQAIDRRMQEYIAMMERESRMQRPPRSGPAIVATLALVLAVLGIGLTGFMAATSSMGVDGYVDYWSERIERVLAASRVQQAPLPAPVASRPAAPPPVAEAPEESPAPPVAEAPEEPVTAPSAPGRMPAAEPEPLPETESPVARAPEEPKSTRPAPAKQLPRAVQAAAKAAAQKPRGTAVLILAVSPGGELYIDGERHGTTPPITTLDLAPGLRRIEVRNGSRKPYLTYMTVEPGDVRRIQHDFNARWSRPPG